LKTLLMIGSGLIVVIALADLATGKSSTPILPDALGNMLTQERDVFLLIGSVAGLWYAGVKL
jgi:hypothetical protein